MKKQQYLISNFVCPNCDSVIPLPRRRAQQRGKNHVKDLYCPFCRTEQHFREVQHKDSYVTFNGKIIYS